MVTLDDLKTIEPKQQATKKYTVVHSVSCSVLGVESITTEGGRKLDTVYFMQDEAGSIVGWFVAERHGGQLVVDFAFEMDQKPEYIEIKGSKLPKFYVRYSLTKRTKEQEQQAQEQKKTTKKAKTDDMPF